MEQQPFQTLQALMWPDPTLCADMGLTLRLTGAQIAEGIAFADGGSASFDTAFNVFPWRKWQGQCGLRDLWLWLEGQGKFTVTIATLHTDAPFNHRTQDPDSLVPPTPTRREVLSATVTLGTATRIDLGLALNCPEAALYVTLTALGPAHLTGATWQTRQPPLRKPRIALGITTFQREAQITATVTRFLDATLDPCFHLIVVDNGGTVALPTSDRITLIPNRNLGGAGGFARCLREAFAMGASHALFMDDDAAVDMQALDRTRAFLSYARDPATSVIGGLMQAGHPTRLWESGAQLRQFCRPLFRHLDLRSPGAVAQLESLAPDPAPPNLYGGFWFFAFPLDLVRHWPFPFFVRGDDINFSLSNPFRLTTLPGVASFQDQDFSDKESALTLYLDLRNHLIQPLVLPALDEGILRYLYVILHFFGRSLMQMHLDSLRSLNLAVADVLRGPAFFAANADMTGPRARIAALRRYEVWQDLAGPPPEQRLTPANRLPRLLMILSLNGLLLPFFGQWGNHLVLARNQRGKVHLIWGAAQISYVDDKRQQIMTLRHNKAAAFGLVLVSIANLARLILRYPGLRRQWRAGYGGLTSAEFWEKQFFPDRA